MEHLRAVLQLYIKGHSKRSIAKSSGLSRRKRDSRLLAGRSLSDTPLLEGKRNSEWAHTIGTGFRYEIARIPGTHTGIDFARGKAKDSAFYIVSGSSWL